MQHFNYGGDHIIALKFIPGDSEKVLAFLNRLMTDVTNDYRYGPISDRIENKIPRLWRVWLRKNAREIHPKLLELEWKYMKLIEDGVAQSMYSYDKLLSHYSVYERHLDAPTFSHGMDKFVGIDSELAAAFPKSHRFIFDSTGLDLSKGAGLPKMGPKKDNLNAARQYANKIKAYPETPAYMFLPGIRTQPDKTRGIWQDPMSEWYLEVEGFRDAIKSAVDEAKREHKFYQQYYCTPEHMQKFLFREGNSQFVVFDWQQYDAYVTADEITDYMLYTAGEYEPIQHMIAHAVSAPIQMPESILERYGGLASGKYFTNHGGTAKNVDGMWNVLEELKLDRYVSRFSGNGDDQAWVLDTVLTDRNLEKIADKSSPRILEPSKCYHDTTSVWYSKVFYTANYFTKPGSLVTYGTIHREHEMSPDTNSKQYVAIAFAQKLEPLKGYPAGGGDYLAKEIKKLDKYPIDSFSRKELQPYWDVYKSTHSYLDEQGRLGDLDELRLNGFYASA